MGDEYYDDWEQSYEKEVDDYNSKQLTPVEQVVEEAVEPEDEIVENVKHLEPTQIKEEDHWYHGENIQVQQNEDEDLDLLYETNVRGDDKSHDEDQTMEIADERVNTFNIPKSQQIGEDKQNQDPPYRSYIEAPVDLRVIDDEDVLAIAKQHIHPSKSLKPQEEDDGDDEYNPAEEQGMITSAIRNELTRLSSLLGVTSNMSSETDLVKFLQDARSKVEKMKYSSSLLSDKSQVSDEYDPSNNYSPGGTRKKPSKLRSKLRAAHEQDGSGGVDSELQRINAKEEKISKKAQRLEENIKESFKKIKPPTSDWETRYRRMVNKYRKEKEERMAYEEFIKVQNKKVRVLVEHIEKLMKAIKYENGKRMQLFDDFSKFKKDNQKLQQKFEKQDRYIAAQKRALSEVTQGSKILEDQLKLMDEKYLELRSKLDFARNFFSGTIKKLKIESQELRVKYAHATGGLFLDQVKLPSKSEGFDVTQTALRPISSQSPSRINNQSMHGQTFMTTGNGIPFDESLGPTTRQEVHATIKFSDLSEEKANIVVGSAGPSSRPKSAGPSRKSSVFGACSKDPRPQSAFPTPSQHELQNQGYVEYQPIRSSSAKVRPKSAAPAMESPLNRLSAKDKDKALTYLCKKITDKDKNSKVKEKWTADKLADLLSNT